MTTITTYTGEDKAYEKTRKVILSCKTTAQMNSAKRMIKLFAIKYGQYYEYAKLVDIFYHKSNEFVLFKMGGVKL